MIDSIPAYVSLLFIVLVLVSMYQFFLATKKDRGGFVIILLVALLQAVLSQRGFYTEMNETQPRLALILVPSVLIILFGFFTPRGKTFIAKIDLEKYTYLHTVRVGVELVLYSLFLHAMIPESMTFAGRNWDILTGLTAPFVAYFGYRKLKINAKGRLIWNIIGLLLVLQVVITGIFSAPSPFQKLAFDQPNIGIQYFPFIWLPSILVPLVIFGHLVAIKRWKEAAK